MTAADVLALLPLLLIAATSVAVMAAAGVGATIRLPSGSLLPAWRRAFLDFLRRSAPGDDAAVMDSYALFFMGLMTRPVSLWRCCLRLPGATGRQSGRVLYPAFGGDARRHGARRQYPLRLVLSRTGSPERRALCADRLFGDRPRPVEAGIKYLVLAGASFTFLLFGIALV